MVNKLTIIVEWSESEELTTCEVNKLTNGKSAKIYCGDLFEDLKQQRERLYQAECKMKKLIELCDNGVVCGSSDESDRQLLKLVEDWDKFLLT